MNVTLVTATLSVAVALSVVSVPRFRFVLVPCTAVGAATVGAVVSGGGVTVTVTNRLSTAGAPFDGVAVSLKTSAWLAAPTATTGAVKVAFGVFGLLKATDVPETCAHFNIVLLQ